MKVVSGRNSSILKYCCFFLSFFIGCIYNEWSVDVDGEKWVQDEMKFWSPHKTTVNNLVSLKYFLSCKSKTIPFWVNWLEDHIVQLEQKFTQPLWISKCTEASWLLSVVSVSSTKKPSHCHKVPLVLNTHFAGKKREPLNAKSCMRLSFMQQCQSRFYNYKLFSLHAYFGYLISSHSFLSPSSTLVSGNENFCHFASLPITISFYSPKAVSNRTKSR